MKRFSIIVLGALAMLMAGCSKDAPVSPPDENAWIKDVNLPVPVLFGSSSLSATTKADDPGMIEGETLIERRVGVIGIDADAETWREKPLNSNGTLYTLNKDALLLHKLVRTTTEGNIEFNPREYYPLVSDQNFNFYGYYPENLSSNLYLSTRTELPGSSSGNQIVAINCDIGYQDILWAGTTNDNKVFEYGTDDEGNPLTVTGYNAKYIRKIKYAQMDIDADETLSDAVKEEKKAELESYMPQLKFKHCLSAARFYVQAKDSHAAGTFKNSPESPNDPNGTILEVTGLTLKGLYNKGSLIVAIKENNTGEDISKWEGVVVPASGASSTSIVLTQPNGDDIEPVVPIVSAKELGKGLMLIPGSETLDYSDGIEGIVTYNIWVRNQDGSPVLNEDGTQMKQTKSLDVKFPVSADNNFIAGKRYAFTIVFNSLEEVMIKTSLEAWDDNHPGGNGYEIEGGGEGGEHIEIE